MPATPLFLFAPGAGAPSSSAWMRAWAERLGTLGAVRAFDYPYAREGRRAPDRLPVLIAAHREALTNARGGHPGPLFLVGKSMGGRVGCHVALEDDVRGLVCLGYPLRSPAGALRDQVLVDLKTPVLFVQGTRDPLCPLAGLAEVRARMRAPSALHVVEGGDHSLQVRKTERQRRGSTQEAVDREILAAVAAFVSAGGSGPVPPGS